MTPGVFQLRDAVETDGAGEVLAASTSPVPRISHGDNASTPLRDIAHDLLQLAAEGEFDDAASCLEQLFNLRGRFPSYALLRDIAFGRQAIVRSGSIYVVGTQIPSAAMAAQLEEAMEACASFLGLSQPCVLLHCLADTPDLHLTIESFPGLATMRISSLTAGFPDDLREVMFHEMAHCHLTCGVRLLDEGLAYFFAHRYAHIDLPVANQAPLPGMGVLLSRTANSMFGEESGSNLATYLSACRAGADLITAVHAEGGAQAIKDLFAVVSRASSDEEVIKAVERASRQNLAVQTDAKPDASNAHRDLIEQTRQAIFSAWEKSVTDSLDSIITALQAQDVYAHPQLLDSLINAQLNRALLIVNEKQDTANIDVGAIDLLLKAADSLPQGRLWLWRGTRAILAICLARPNIIKVATAGQQALRAFDKAVQIIPNDPDLLVQHASLLLNAPPDYGGNRDLGVAKLRQAMQTPVYHRHASRILLKYGIEVENKEGNDSASLSDSSLVADDSKDAHMLAPQPGSGLATADAPVAIQINDLQLKLSASFALRPADFAIRSGERVALVGRNGSGKSILLETMLGLRQADSGEVKLQFRQPRGKDVRRLIGGLVQGTDLPGQNKVSEIMALHAVIYPVTDTKVTKALGLAELAHLDWGRLSRGQQQRVLLWLALAHRPEIVFLDEPSLGLDEWFARALRELLINWQGTVVVISHIPADLLITQRVLCLEDGAISDQGTLPELIARHAGKYKANILQTLSAELLDHLRALPGLIAPPRETEQGWEMFGGAGFDEAFRHFIHSHGVTGFSLQAASVEDFLARISRANGA